MALRFMNREPSVPFFLTLKSLYPILHRLFFFIVDRTAKIFSTGNQSNWLLSIPQMARRRGRLAVCWDGFLMAVGKVSDKVLGIFITAPVNKPERNLTSSKIGSRI